MSNINSGDSSQEPDKCPLPTRRLGRTNEQVTIFGLGGEGILRTYGREEEAAAVINRALDQGVNYFDSAPAYSGCLDYLGHSLGDRRDGILIASKTHDRTRDGSLRLLDDTLTRLQTDHLDVWQLHDLRTRADLEHIFGKGGALEALLAARDDGRVRYLGITGHHDPAILIEALRRFEFDTALVALNAADVHRLSFLKTVIPAACSDGLGVIAMKVYAQGALLKTGRFGARLGQSGLTTEEAFGYAVSQPGVSLAILGCSTVDEVDENARLAREFAKFDDARLRALEQRTSPNATAFTSYKRLEIQADLL